ncbi:MAG TPA: gephyrin-like molybdotransferase Glp [Bryobacteraceae bacterium]|nr:gephyrin-like molybdotransferase Glp [Bryobacteraceae bacterium]
MPLTFVEARNRVLQEVVQSAPSVECVALAESAGRVLAEPVHADRDYPPFPRSARDGFAIRTADLAGPIRVIGEVRAGEIFSGSIGEGEAVEIMTGAPLPAGADAVLMIEHARRDGDRITTDRSLNPGDNFNPRGVEARAGGELLAAAKRIGYAEIALLAMVGRVQVPVFRKPRVAILSTGDEIVDIDQKPKEFQIRNSNAWSLAAQVARAGAIPEILPIARDHYDATRDLAERGLRADMLLVSGGVSAGKYDIVERVLADLGAKFYFDRVLIQPGQPVVFGAVPQSGTEKFFFGLPGNPLSTMVTFELFARAAIVRLSGAGEAPLPMLRAKLAREFHHKPGLTRFLPAELGENGTTVTPLAWHGSGDIASIARANAFLVADADRESWAAGDDIRVLIK